MEPGKYSSSQANKIFREHYPKDKDLNPRNGKSVKARLAAKLAASRPQPPQPPPPPAPKLHPVSMHISPSDQPRMVRVTTIEGGTPDERANAAINLMRDRAEAEVNARAARSSSPIVVQSSSNPALHDDDIAAIDGMLAAEMAVTGGKVDVSDEDWMRGFCATADKYIFTVKESLISAAMAMGKQKGHNVQKESRLTEPASRDEILNDAVAVISIPIEENLQAAFDGLAALTAADYMLMDDDAVWKFCEVLVAVADLCPMPSRIAPLAMRWIRHTQEKKLHMDHLKANILVAKYFSARGHPAMAGRLIERGIAHAAKHTLLSPSGTARLYMLRATYFCDADNDAAALIMYRHAIDFSKVDTDKGAFPPSLLVELHCAAVIPAISSTSGPSTRGRGSTCRRRSRT